MVIGACGYGATGSSVLTDLLREYDDIQIFDDFEFILTYRVDGLQDLQYHLMERYSKNQSGDYAIKRFLKQSKCYNTPFINKPCDGKTFQRLSEEYISEILQLSFKGVDTADVLSGNTVRDIFAFASKKVLMPKIIEKILRRQSFVWPCRTLYYSIEPENFFEASRRYINRVLDAMGVDPGKPVVLDQPFEGNAPENSFPFYDDPYAVVVDKDPRDLYLAAKYTKDPNFKFTPKTNVDDFIVFYRNMRKRKTDNERILRVRFEDFIYEYDKTVAQVAQFLHLGEHKRPKSLFNPARSVNNTQLIRLHPEDRDAVRKIEQELPEFLYPYENYPDVKFEGRPFDGAARKAFSQ